MCGFLFVSSSVVRPNGFACFVLCGQTQAVTLLRPGFLFVGSSVVFLKRSHSWVPGSCLFHLMWSDSNVLLVSSSEVRLEQLAPEQ